MFDAFKEKAILDALHGSRTDENNAVIVDHHKLPSLGNNNIEEDTYHEKVPESEKKEVVDSELLDLKLLLSDEGYNQFIKKVSDFIAKSAVNGIEIPNKTKELYNEVNKYGK
jgi:hypothetical protein